MQSGRTNCHSHILAGAPCPDFASKLPLVLPPPNPRPYTRTHTHTHARARRRHRAAKPRTRAARRGWQKGGGTDAVDDWGPVWRHTAHNCTIGVPRSPRAPDTQDAADAADAATAAPPKPAPAFVDVHAVCQTPLHNPGAAGTSGGERFASAPKDITEYYSAGQPVAPRADADAGGAGARAGAPPQAEQPAQSWITMSDTPTPVPADVPAARPSDAPRDLVLVVGGGPSPPEGNVRLFVRSLRATGCDADVVLFLDHGQVENFVGIAKEFGGMQLFGINSTALNKRFKYGKPVVLYRFALYEHFLQSVPSGTYRRCMHADLFDTFFQRDPFSTVELRGGLALFTENVAIEIGSCSFHRYWFKQCRVPSILYRSHSLPRICMGFVMGTFEAFKVFIKMTLFSVLKRCNDQGVLNILAHSGQYAEMMNVTVYTPRHGLVVHVNTDWNYNEADGGLILNEAGEPYVAVHQWDRLGRLNDGDGTVHLFSASQPRGKRRSSREAGQRRKWLTKPKHDWSMAGQVTPACVVADAARTEVVCRSGKLAQRDGRTQVFCPTHTRVVAPTNSSLRSVQ